ncbi:MAG: FHA domain-containing protein [Actinomycetota bacterium]
MSARIEYAPGEAWCIAAGRVVLVCERDLPAVRARALHDAAGVIDSVEALRTVLELEPAALLGAVDLDEGRVLLRRHGVPATADGEPLADRYGAAWALDEVPAAAIVAAGALATLTVDVLPLDSGVVRAAAVRVAARPVEEVADAAEDVREDATADVAEPEPRTGAFGETLPPEGSRDTATAEPPAAPEPQPRPAQHPIGGLIDSVPGFIRPAVDLHAVEPALDIPRETSATASIGDHDGMTITAEQARALQEERARAAEPQVGADAHAALEQDVSSSAPATGPLVLSTLCGSGHVNPPGSVECLQCGGPVDDGSAAQRRRPEVAVAVLPSGERIPLGRGVVLGRRPRSRRAEDGRVPRLVTVESPGEDISRSHLELRIDDWNLVGIDLSSTNGTLLQRDGQAPQRLRPEASTILQLGDRLDLGEGVVVTIEPAQRRPAQSEPAPIEPAP